MSTKNTITNIGTIVSIIVGLIFIYSFISSLATTVPTPTLQATSKVDPEHLLPIDLLSIEGLKSRQNVYGLKENATVDFIIKDKRELPYNLTVSWLHNDTIYYVWSYESNSTQPFYSYYSVNELGEWKVHVILKYIFQNQIYSKDLLTEFVVS